MYVHSNIIMRTTNFYSEKVVRNNNYIGVRNFYSCDDSSTQSDFIMSDIDVLEQTAKRLNDSH